MIVPGCPRLFLIVMLVPHMVCNGFDGSKKSKEIHDGSKLDLVMGHPNRRTRTDFRIWEISNFQNIQNTNFLFCLLGSRNSLTICKLKKDIFVFKKFEQNLHSCVNFWPWGWIKHCWMFPLLVQNHPTSLRISKVAKDTIESLTTVLPALVLPQVVWSCSLETTRLTVVQDSSVNGSLVVIKFSHRVWPVLTRLAIIFCCIMQAVFVLSQHTLSVSFILTLVTK